MAVVDSVSFLIAACLIAWISAPTSPDVDHQEGEVVSAWTRTWQEWREGLHVVARNRAIAVLFLVANITSLGGTMIDPLYEPFILSILHAGATAVGLVSTATAIGGIVGGLLLAQFGVGTRPAVLVFLGNSIAGLCLLILYHQTMLPPALVFGFLLGIPLVGTSVGLDTYAQTSTPDRYRGRVWRALGTTKPS